MGTRNHNHRLVKIHRTYSVEEMAALFGIHKNTVRHWLGNGLATIDRQRPLLVHGRELKAFLKANRTRNKVTTPPGHIYCLRCRVPKRPLGGAVTYRELTTGRGDLAGSCPDCGAGLNRRVSSAKLTAALADLRLRGSEAPKHIDERAHPSGNCDFNQEASAHA